LTITPNPTDARLKYVWDKQKPQVEPLVMMDVIAAVANRVAPVASSQAATWADRIEDAGKVDLRFLDTFQRWRHSHPSIYESGRIDAPFVDAVVALVTEMPEFKKTSPIDALIPWFAKEMNRLFLLQKDPDADEYPAYYAAKYNRLQTALSAPRCRRLGRPGCGEPARPADRHPRRGRRRRCCRAGTREEAREQEAPIVVAQESTLTLRLSPFRETILPCRTPASIETS
jgi:hypothetical protein